MKVLQLGKYYPPHRGGMETVVETLSEELATLGHEVTVLCANDTCRTIQEYKNKVRIVRLARFGVLFSQPLLPSAFFHVLAECRKADIVHLHSPNPLVEALVALAGSRLIITYHADVTKQRGLLPVYSWLRSRILARARKIVVASRNLARSSPALDPFQGKVATIPFGLDGAKFVPTNGSEERAQALRKEYGSYFLFVGRLVGYKGLPVLLRAMSQVEGKLLLVGEGPDRTELEQASRNFGLTEKVYFLGSIESEQELAALFSGAVALLLPSVSRAEAFGMVLIEAMGWGRPVITTNLDTGVSEVNDTGVTGLTVPVGDASALAAAMGELLRDPAKAARLGANGRTKFLETYAAVKMAEAYQKIYEGALA